jgi:hypothetical protein
MPDDLLLQPPEAKTEMHFLAVKQGSITDDDIDPSKIFVITEAYLTKLAARLRTASSHLTSFTTSISDIVPETERAVFPPASIQCASDSRSTGAPERVSPKNSKSSTFNASKRAERETVIRSLSGAPSPCGAGSELFMLPCFVKVIIRIIVLLHRPGLSQPMSHSTYP